MNGFGTYIKKIRESRGLSLNQVALYSKISAAQLSRIENGKRGIPKPATIKAISEALKINYEDLMKKAGYISKDDNEITVAGQEVHLTKEELEVFNELKKHPILFHDLKTDPEKKVKELIKLQKMKKLFLDEDDSDQGNGFGDLED